MGCGLRVQSSQADCSQRERGLVHSCRSPCRRSPCLLLQSCQPCLHVLLGHRRRLQPLACTCRRVQQHGVNSRASPILKSARAATCGNTRQTHRARLRAEEREEHSGLLTLTTSARVEDRCAARAAHRADCASLARCPPSKTMHPDPHAPTPSPPFVGASPNRSGSSSSSPSSSREGHQSRSDHRAG